LGREGVSKRNIGESSSVYLSFANREYVNQTEGSRRIRAALHLEAGPIPLETDCMEFQPFVGLEVGLNYTL
jgi:hypothetical protein